MGIGKLAPRKQGLARPGCTAGYHGAMNEGTGNGRQRALAMLALVMAGEMIFCLPFHLPRYFRPSVLDTFGLSNADLGDVFAVYGVCAMLAYFPGGYLADRYAARTLLCVSLVATAAGGLVLLALPGTRGLALVYGWWGLTTILLFWAAMIRATRDWGGSAQQGRAFGLLEGGRGLCAAAFASLGVALFAALLADPAHTTTETARAFAVRGVIAYYTVVTLLAAVLVRVALPLNPSGSSPGRSADRAVLLNPRVWLIAATVVCAYCGYKGLDHYGLYVHEVLGMSETEAAAFTASSAFLRPLAALVAGLVADRSSGSRTMVALFAVTALCDGLLAAADGRPAVRELVLANLLLTYASVFAMRGVYFALLAHSAVPRASTGVAVGLVSMIGFTPDIFFWPLAGRLLDDNPGIVGHQHYFALLAMIAVVGLMAAGLLSRSISRHSRIVATSS